MSIAARIEKQRPSKSFGYRSTQVVLECLKLDLQFYTTTPHSSVTVACASFATLPGSSLEFTAFSFNSLKTFGCFECFMPDSCNCAGKKFPSNDVAIALHCLFSQIQVLNSLFCAKCSTTSLCASFWALLVDF